MQSIEDRHAEIVIHQQANQVGVARERTSVGMVSGQKNPRWILDSQEQLQADRPLESMDKLAFFVSKREQATAGLAFQVLKNHLARTGELSIRELVHGVSRKGDRLTEENLADVDRDMVGPIHPIGEFRCFGTESMGTIASVAMVLGMGQVDPASLDRIECREGRGDVSGCAQVAAVDVQWVCQPEFLCGCGKRP